MERMRRVSSATIARQALQERHGIAHDIGQCTPPWDNFRQRGRTHPRNRPRTRVENRGGRVRGCQDCMRYRECTGNPIFNGHVAQA